MAGARGHLPGRGTKVRRLSLDVEQDAVAVLRRVPNGSVMAFPLQVPCRRV